MTVSNYFELGITSGTKKRYKAIDWKPSDEIPGEIRMDLMGVFSGVRGENYEKADIVAKAHAEAADPYGSIDDLRDCVKHKGKLYYTDFYGNEYEALVQPGSARREAISTILEGDPAWFLLPISLIYKEESYP